MTDPNTSCPCGSGRKHKNCCGSPAAASGSHDGAVQRVIAWLEQRHRKAWLAAVREMTEDAVFGQFDSEGEARAAMAGVAAEVWQMVEINFTEWLLAEGDIDIKGAPQRVSDLLLGPRGPLLAIGQRAWMAQLAQRPLRLYDVTGVEPGVGVTVCDALDTTQPPLVVAERSGSRSMRPGMKIGARVMTVAKGHQFSGALYPFTDWAGQALLNHLRRMLIEPVVHPDDAPQLVGREIIDDWLAQYLQPAALPELVHSASGERLLFVTDHYEVRDWHALAAGLATQPDVQGDRAAGWDRLIIGDDGQTRSLVTVAPQPGGRRVAVQYKTAGLAERGRPWLDALAGGALKFLLQEVSDPKGLLTRSAADGKAIHPRDASKVPSAKQDVEGLSEAVETYIQHYYARWADEPMPALKDQTPRQAMQTAAGLERVKGLLRSYEDGEHRQATQQGRRSVSYQFLWDALGLQR